MRVRLPKIDYSNVRPDWAPNREFAHDRNASSTIPTHVEPYLIKVMQKAKAELPAHHAELHREIDIFIAQESQHFRQHNAFNRRIREAGYPGLEAFENELRDTYVAFLANRSLKFNLAYSEGFESLGPPAAALWFEHSDAFLEGADPEAVALWKWHMAEEFEHRETCHRLFHALYSRNLWQRFWNGWLYRCYGFLYAAVHLGRYTKAVRRYLIATDRAKMSPEEIQQSVANVRAVGMLAREHMVPELIKVFSPFYDPGKKPEPRGLAAYLERFDKNGDMGLAR
jgi:uncharacterized protein